MKKIIFVLTMLVGMTFMSCNGCKGNKDTDTPTIAVETVNQSDLTEMLISHTNDSLKWYECDILLNQFLDEENDGSIQELVNIYQINDEVDSKVFKIQHFPNNIVYKDSVRGFWIENFAIDINDIKVTYNEAYNKVMSVNLPKPHSQHVTIRKPIGPIECNVQYIFGNIHQQIWVDATTGEIRESNPAFPPVE